MTDLLQRYEEAVDKLAAEFAPPTLLDVLLLRDSIEQILPSRQIEERRHIDDLLETDRKLRALPWRAYHRNHKCLALWRHTIKPAAQAWWWFLDRTLPAPLERLERAALIVSIALFPISLGLAIELARLHGGEVVGMGSLLPIIATFLGSLSLSGILSVSFRDRCSAFLEEIGLGAWWRALATGMILLLLITIAGVWLLRPRISRYYNGTGVSALLEGNGRQTQLSSALIDLERAVRFDPTNTVAHYNLGRVYEDLVDTDRAINHYLIAFRAGLDLAGNNLSHIYLLRGEYDRAALVLQKSIALADGNGRSSDLDLRYVMLKNLGWARFGQSRLPEARQLLEEALQLRPDHADAHCLLAKTLEGLRDEDAVAEWRSCLGLAWRDVTEPAREIWTTEARSFVGRAQ